MRWELEQLVKLNEAHPELVNGALHALWEQQPDVLRRVILGAYIDQQINLSKAAEMLGLTRLELQRQLLQQGIPVRTLTPDDLHAEVTAIQQGTPAG